MFPKIKTFLSGCIRDCPFRVRCAIMAMSVLLAAMVLCTIHTGCASTQAGLSREQGIYRVSTNVVSGVQQIVPYLPAPVATPAEILLGAISAGLGAWNLHQQRALKKLKNGSKATFRRCGTGSCAGRSACQPGSTARIRRNTLLACSPRWRGGSCLPCAFGGWFINSPLSTINPAMPHDFYNFRQRMVRLFGRVAPCRTVRLSLVLWDATNCCLHCGEADPGWRLMQYEFAHWKPFST